jgi:hypothetical protein
MTTIEQDAEKCSQIIAATHASFQEAGRAIAESCDRHTGFIDYLHKVLRGSVSVSYLRRLERCGRGELIPEFVVCVGPAQHWVEKLSIRDQKTALTGVAWPVGDDDSDTRIKLVSDMTYDEAKACFCGGTIGSPETIRVKILALMEAAQRTQHDRVKWIEKREKQHVKAIAKVKNAGISIYCTYIVWNGVRITEDELNCITHEMDRMKYDRERK